MGLGCQRESQVAFSEGIGKELGACVGVQWLGSSSWFYLHNGHVTPQTSLLSPSHYGAPQIARMGMEYLKQMDREMVLQGVVFALPQCWL